MANILKRQGKRGTSYKVQIRLRGYRRLKPSLLWQMLANGQL